MLKDEPEGKKNRLAEQRSLARAWEEKKKKYEMWKKERTTQEDYKEVIGLCREKIRSTKAQA